MPPIHHRDPGVIGLLGEPVSSSRPYFGLIVDGLHSHPNTVRIAYSAHKDGCIVVTDAQSPLDPALEDGIHDWRPGVVFRKKGDAVYAIYDGVPGETLAGRCVLGLGLG
jgi:N-acetylglucosamine-6-phosphate deacetylase